MSGDQIFGGIFTSLGLLSLLTYLAYFAGLKTNAVFRKLGLMQERWGKNLGTAIHFTGYVIVPLTVGISLLLGHRP